MIHQPTERELWFQKRIGMRVYRNETSCKCEICKDAFENGLVINDKLHADYLYDCETEYTAEGSLLRYFDSREEVDKWLATLPK